MLNVSDINIFKNINKHIRLSDDERERKSVNSK